MDFRRFALFSLALALVAPAAAPQTTAIPVAASAPTAVPSLVPYSGSALDSDGRPLAGPIGVTFQIYKDEIGGESLWTESQTVSIDASGHYKVQLGATSLNGLPSDLFATGEARWLEVQIAGEKPGPRVLLAGYETARLVDVTDQLKRQADQREKMRHPAVPPALAHPAAPMQTRPGVPGTRAPLMRIPASPAQPIVKTPPKIAELK